MSRHLVSKIFWITLQVLLIGIIAGIIYSMALPGLKDNPTDPPPRRGVRR